MSAKEYNRRLTEARAAVARLENTLQALQTANPERYAANRQQLSIQAAYQSEELTCHLRHLVYRLPETDRQRYLEGAMPAAGVELHRTDNAVSLIFPLLLPNRKRQEGREYLAGLTYAALTQAARQKPLPRFDHCLMVVVHCFAPGWQENVTPDYDNIELKTVQDLLALFMLPDDSMKYCDRLETARTDETPHTEFHLVRSGTLEQWLKEEKNAGRVCPFFENFDAEKWDGIKITG